MLPVSHIIIHTAGLTMFPARENSSLGWALPSAHKKKNHHLEVFLNLQENYKHGIVCAYIPIIQN